MTSVPAVYQIRLVIVKCYFLPYFSSAGGKGGLSVIVPNASSSSAPLAHRTVWLLCGMLGGSHVRKLSTCHRELFSSVRAFCPRNLWKAGNGSNSVRGR